MNRFKRHRLAMVSLYCDDSDTLLLRSCSRHRPFERQELSVRKYSSIGEHGRRNRAYALSWNRSFGRDYFETIYAGRILAHNCHSLCHYLGNNWIVVGAVSGFLAAGLNSVPDALREFMLTFPVAVVIDHFIHALAERGIDPHP